MTPMAYYDATILSLGALFLGIIMLIKGGNWAVDAAVYVANRFGISPMVVGFTIVAFGTSLPELVVSVLANLQGLPNITLGNVLGSNIANILMVLGIAGAMATLKTPVTKGLTRDLVFMLLSTVLLAGLLHYGMVSRTLGLVLVLILVGYVFYQYLTTKEDAFEQEVLDEGLFKNQYYAYATLIVGMLSIAIGAEFLVKGAKVSAGLIGVPESVIALSIIAFGTSLPELSTSIIAARKGQSEMVLGNIVGSNVFNILMIVGFSSIVMPITKGSFADQLAHLDVWITLAVGVLLAAVIFMFGRISRVTGVVFFVAYILYNIYIYAINMSA